jgi:hypothetical protein
MERNGRNRGRAREESNAGNVARFARTGGGLEVASVSAQRALEGRIIPNLSEVIRRPPLFCNRVGFTCRRASPIAKRPRDVNDYISLKRTLHLRLAIVKGLD